MTTMRSLWYPEGKCLGTLAERSLVGTPTSYLLRSTCSSALGLPEVLRAAADCVFTREGRFRRGLLGASASTNSSLRMECQPAIFFFVPGLPTLFSNRHVSGQYSCSITPSAPARNRYVEK